MLFDEKAEWTEGKERMKGRKRKKNAATPKGREDYEVFVI